MDTGVCIDIQHGLEEFQKDIENTLTTKYGCPTSVLRDFNAKIGAVTDKDSDWENGMREASGSFFDA